MKGTALITGASSGIGAAAAEQLAAAGHEVILTARRTGELEAVRERITAKGGKARVVPADLADPRAGQMLAQACGQELEVLVLNAGIVGPTPVGEAGAPGFRKVLDLNLTAPLRLLRTLAPSLVDGARVLVVSSVLARIGAPGAHGYCASKAGLNGLVKAAALELAPRRITINALCPTWVDTPMARGSFERQGETTGRGADDARESFVRSLPLGRILTADEVADWIAWLTGERATGMTGQAVGLDLGLLATGTPSMP